MRIAMSLSVAEDADIIRDHIEFHAEQGVDCFAVSVKPGCNDEVSILERLKRDYKIEIFKDSRLDLADRRSARICWLESQMEAEWIIESSAQEFWFTPGVPLAVSIKKAIAKASLNGSDKAEVEEIGSLQCLRHVMLSPASAIALTGYHFYDNTWKVQGSIPALPVNFEPSLVSICRSGYGINTSNAAIALPVNDIHVLAYPVREFEQYAAAMQFDCLISTSGQKVADETGRKVAIEGVSERRLRQAYNQYIVTGEKANELQARDLLSRDFTMLEYFESKVPLACAVG